MRRRLQAPNAVRRRRPGLAGAARDGAEPVRDHNRSAACRHAKGASPTFVRPACELG